MSPDRIEPRIRLAGSLIIAGLLVQALSLLKIHPLAFVAFLAVGCPLVLAGVILFLYALVRPEPRS